MTSNSERIKIVTSIGAALVSILFVIGGTVWLGQTQSHLFAGTQEKYTGPIEKIVVANQREFSIFNYIAREKGYFMENGLDVEIREFESGAPAVADLWAGNVDVASVGEFVAVSSVLDGKQLRIIAETSKQRTIRLVARRDSGISNPSDLRGKKIGMTLGTASEIFGSKFLLFNGLLFPDVEIIDLSPLEMVDEIAVGNIDAAITHGPHTYTIERKLGTNAISWSAQGDEVAYAILISSDEFIKSHPQAVRRYVQALFQAEQYLRGHEAEAKSILKKSVNYDDSYIAYLWPDTIFRLALEQELLSVLENETRWAIRNKLTDKTMVPNYLDYMYVDAIEGVNPEAVTIIWR